MTPAETQKVLDAIHVVRGAVPMAARVLELVEPEATPIVEVVQPLLDKLFRAVDSLASGGTPEEAAQEYARKLANEWQHDLDGA